jgi:hypothetical protein
MLPPGRRIDLEDPRSGPHRRLPETTDEYEERVVRFFDQALLGRTQPIA